jgi:tetratricopeptide (TPR) repeat protein
MTKARRIFGWLVFSTSLAVLPVANAATDAVQDETPTQMLELADKALAAAQLSAQDRARLLVRRGFALELLGRRADALADFNEAIASSALSSEEQAGALYNRGVTLDEINRTDDAIADYTAAINLVPKLAAAYNNRGNALRRLGRLAEAEHDYEASMDAGNLHPEYPEYGMGQIAEALGQLSAARQYYRSALAASPQFSLASDRLAAMGGSADAWPETPIVLTKPASGEPPRAIGSAAVAGAAPALKPAISDTPSAANLSVQLGAYRSEAEANAAWADLRKSAGDLLTALSPLIIAVDLPGKGRWYRLRVGKLELATATQLCATLKTKGITCIVPPD